MSNARMVGYQTVSGDIRENRQYLNERLGARHAASGEGSGWRKSRVEPNAGEYTQSIEKTIEGEIIPRLMLLHRSEARDDFEPNKQDWAATTKIIEEFAAVVLLETNIAVPLAHIAVLREEGASLEAIFLELLAPTARLLGDYWIADICSFSDVTIGLSMLQRLLRELTTEFEAAAVVAASSSTWRRALLTPTVGDQHTFGLSMVTEFLCRAGWDVRLEPAITSQGLRDAVGTSPFELIGFSLSNPLLKDQLASDIRMIRNYSMNQDIGVLVGGNAFTENPELADEVGADSSASDGRQAVEEGEKLLEVGGGGC